METRDPARFAGGVGEGSPDAPRARGRALAVRFALTAEARYALAWSLRIVGRMDDAACLEFDYFFAAAAGMQLEAGRRAP
jgi:hypothetical protein